ncbi:YchJ family protein [Breznakiella homolactica]|uniref:YchJ family protein n=1 Tax=Breznakiella homolactica TaxID=2798577 RepID=A0A7T7XNP6_9SPIR|nr:YchJ family protein [Breznakiella homolactica]QQO09686.1 YchJ family protein [Breznakiella homolactica]
MKLCPCGSGRAYTECCGPYITGAQKAPTAEALMRSRYSAYAEHEINYILNTCTSSGERDIDEKQTRDWSEKSEWLGLEIHSVIKGGPGDDEGTVEFTASYMTNGLKDRHHERARFTKTNGEWLYSDGDIIPETIVRQGPKVGRNEPCPCGSGKKYKHCCGRGA